MTREEALATLYARCQHCEETDRAFAFLAEEPTVEPQKWISVKDRLPKEHQGCLFWDEILELGCGSYFTTSRGFGCFWDDAQGSDAKNVVAWMPLPSPYKGE